MNTKLLPVAFHNDTLVLVDQDGEPFIAMRPLVEAMGLAWQSQHIKLTEKFGSTVTIIVTVADDGKNREMVCMPLRKLPGWMYSINPNKVAPELREKIVAYQNECDDALWDYWTKGSASRAGVGLSVGMQLATSKEVSRLLQDLKRESTPAIRTTIHAQLERSCRLLGVPCPALHEVGRNALPQPPVLDEFWEALDWLEAKGEAFNHAKNPHLLAINMPQVMGLLEKHKIKTAPKAELTAAMRDSLQPKFEAYATVKSALTKSAIACWVFQSRA